MLVHLISQIFHEEIKNSVKLCHGGTNSGEYISISFRCDTLQRTILRLKQSERISFSQNFGQKSEKLLSGHWARNRTECYQTWNAQTIFSIKNILHHSQEHIVFPTDETITKNAFVLFPGQYLTSLQQVEEQKFKHHEEYTFHRDSKYFIKFNIFTTDQ